MLFYTLIDLYTLLCLYFYEEYGLTFPTLLSWLYHVEDEEDDIHDRLLGSSLHGTPAEEQEDEDVLAERRRVMSGGADGEVVRIQQLRKIYPANSKAGGLDPLICFRLAWRALVRAFKTATSTDAEDEALASRKRKAANGQRSYKVAVQSLCFGIPKDQCFGFLGKSGILHVCYFYNTTLLTGIYRYGRCRH